MKYNVLWIYILSAFIITIVILVIYWNNERLYTAELNRINSIEQRMKHKKAELDAIRAKTIPCNYKNLNDPRSCYFKSNYTCSWNEEADRCDSL